jgi:glycosyltransferase involved in cell wall biosynthesis
LAELAENDVKMDNLLYITYYWPPSGGPGVQRSLKFVRYLSQQGFLPSVITVDPRQAYYPLTDETLMAEISPDIEVVRTPTSEPFRFYEALGGSRKMPKPGFAGEGKPGLLQIAARALRGNLFVPDPRKGWNKYLVPAALEQIKKNNPVAILTSSPPHSTQLAGLRLKQLTGLPWIADLRDPWTDIYYYSEFRHLPWIRRKDESYERAVLEQADAIVVVSDAIKRLFAAKSNKISPSKIHVIPNGYDPADFIGQAAENPSEFTIAYTGTISGNYNIDGFIKAVSGLFASGHQMKLQIKLTGKISPAVINALQKAGLGNQYTLQDYLPHREAIAAMRSAQMLLLAIPQISENQGILTGKLFEYMATGNKIIGIGPVDGDAAALLKETGTGIMFDYNDQAGMEGFIQQNYTEWIEGRLKRQVLDRTQAFSRPALTAKLAGVIRGLMK